MWDEVCEVSQSLIMKCDLPFTCQDVFDDYIGQEHESSDCACLLHLSRFPMHICVCVYIHVHVWCLYIHVHVGLYCVNHWVMCVCFRASGAMANASPDLDNAEAQRQLNNNNRPIGSGFWETECTSSKLFECSRIKALAGQSSQYTFCLTQALTKPLASVDVLKAIWFTARVN